MRLGKNILVISVFVYLITAAVGICADAPAPAAPTPVAPAPVAPAPAAPAPAKPETPAVQPAPAAPAPVPAVPAAPAVPAPAPKPAVPAPAPAAPAAPAVAAAPQMPQFPYVAEIVGNDVYVRSGPGTAYYHCVKLNAPQRVTIVGSTHGGWLQILPPAGSFSWVSKQYVKVDAAAPKTGIITGDAVRIWAGSDFMEPMRSSSLQTKLNMNAKVEIIGDPAGEGDYYKIAPPAGAYLWISSEFIKIPAPAAAKPAEAKPEEKPAAVAVVPGKLADAVEPVKEEAKPEVKVEQKPKEPPKPSKERLAIDACYALSAKIDAEAKKPAADQNYSGYRKALQAILDDPESGIAKKYAGYMMEKINRNELAISATDILKKQDEQLAQTKKQIDEAHKAQLAKVQMVDEKFIMTGMLKPSYTYSGKVGQKRYLLTNEQGRILCYVSPGDPALEGKINTLLGKKVGLVGRIVNTSKELVTLVSITDVVEIK